MKITVRYVAQLRQAAGSFEEVELERPCSVGELLVWLAKRHGEDLRRLLLDANDVPQPTLLVFLDAEQAENAEVVLTEGVEVTLLSPIAGG